MDKAKNLSQGKGNAVVKAKVMDKAKSVAKGKAAVKAKAKARSAGKGRGRAVEKAKVEGKAKSKRRAKGKPVAKAVVPFSDSEEASRKVISGDSAIDAPGAGVVSVSIRPMRWVHHGARAGYHRRPYSL